MAVTVRQSISPGRQMDQFVLGLHNPCCEITNRAGVSLLIFIFIFLQVVGPSL
jgi:hypothetical protein